jgi:hypothetical protein
MRKFSFKYYIPLLFVLGQLQVYSQVNFVQNPSFEELDTCSVPGFLIPPIYWDTLRAGGSGFPQICSLCGPDNLTVPTTGGNSYQVARTGKNYTYFGVWTAATISPGYTHERSYIQNELRNTLMQGHTYCVTFYTSLMNESKYSISEIGSYLDDGSVATIPSGITLTQVKWHQSRSSFNTRAVFLFLDKSNKFNVSQTLFESSLNRMK